MLRANGSKPDPASPKKGMAKEDKIALVVLVFVLSICSIAVLHGIAYLLDFMGLAGVGLGVSYRTAFLWALFISVLTIIGAIALAFDGLVGDLTGFLLAFCGMLLFWTVSIALVF